MSIEHDRELAVGLAYQSAKRSRRTPRDGYPYDYAGSDIGKLIKTPPLRQKRKAKP